MERWLFETPWWLLVGVAVAACGLLWSGNQRQDRHLKRAGLFTLAAGIALSAVSLAVQTPREICLHQTRRWVSAVVAKDEAILDELLHPDAGLARWNRDDIVAGAVKYADLFG
ncbi:MAG: hypothetical protein NZ561_13615, partial [Phycisphaerae bacterium]|nr:hypothetical protein [Phycisphaerae bacterium]MDW8263145.1 hypothetical protein [Phycisphaerales bacterium]